MKQTISFHVGVTAGTQGNRNYHHPTAINPLHSRSDCGGGANLAASDSWDDDNSNQADRGHAVLGPVCAGVRSHTPDASHGDSSHPADSVPGTEA